MSAKKKKNRTTLTEEKSNPEQFTSAALHQTAFWGFALLLLFPPFLWGLFFPAEQQKVLMLAVLVFWLACLWCWTQKENKILSGPLDYFALALPVVYILSTFTAVNKGLAINEIIKNILYFLAYWSASRLVRNREDVHRLLQVIYLGAVGVALVGLLAATELIYYNDAFLQGRIYSTFQYPNALASYLAAVFFIGIYLWCRTRAHNAGAGRDLSALFSARLYRYIGSEFLYACGNYLLLAVLLGTKSRGGLLAFGLVFLIYLAGLGAGQRLSVVLHTAFTGAVGYLCMDRFIQLTLDKHYGTAWLWMFGGLVLVLCGQVLYMLAHRGLLTRLNAGKCNLAFGCLFALGLAGGGIWLTTQQAIIQKFSGFSFLQNAIERMYFVKDAVEMFKARPLLGWGGGGWEEAYRSFQDYLYNSNQVHSYYFQVGVETGLLGLLAVAGIWLTAVYYIYKIYNKRRDNPELFKITWLLAAVFMVIAGHAGMDFDLSLAALALVLWTTLGIIDSLNRRLEKDAADREAQQQYTMNKQYGRWQMFAVSVVSLFIFTGALMLALANHFAWMSERYLKVGQTDKSLTYIQKAASYNPFSAGYRLTLSKLYLAGGDYDQSLAQARQAVALSPYSSSNRNTLAEAALSAGQYELAAEQAEKAASLSPYQIQWYDALAGKYFSAGYALLNDGENQAAGNLLAKAAALPDQLQTIMDNLPAQYKKMWRDGPPLTSTETMLFAAGAAKYQLGEYNQAEKLLQVAAKSDSRDIRGRALLWLSLAADKKGQTSRAMELRSQAEQLMPNASAEFEKVKKLPVLK
ncbi:O-antigen ligase family protein [Desulfoscipio gibsoniae]|uniref:O-Antigen ligase n=1 Tax=Desulfoscipio gibsoniae DSM 7213 TaxID=767817 RepID=R4KKQ6_9FIRM|nr:O-antigen ligase family protein [Desulfoscipio gibsoniae]AGL03793.1 O-Antigen ligase [Desulfoscipio gibsoniae DSM 7213]